MNREQMEQAKWAKQVKEAREVDNDMNSNKLESEDILFILHKNEVATLEDVILDVLAGKSISLTKEQKKYLINVIHYLQEDE